MSKKEIKETIIYELKDGGYSSYLSGQELMDDSDWKDIAYAVKQTIVYDELGLSYTLDGVTKYLKLAMYEKY